MVRSPSESIAETVAVLLILFAPLLGGAITLLAAFVGIGIVLVATHRRLTPVMVLSALTALAIGLVVAYLVQGVRVPQ